ncbi:MAG: multicopper oxidase domain-containing protein [Nitrosopumilus sp.]|nr:multicopper oxidase domain-containing protein [Nitrosopumilus sp.]NRA06012.1 multicopper oxidase domain-containing protein [Nitrosopumilus sp.]
MTKKILAVSFAVLFAVSMVFVGFTNNVQAHSIPETQIDKSFVLCAYETDGQLIYPDNDIDSLIVGSSVGVFYPESWTFVLIDEEDMELVTDLSDNVRSHDTVNGQDHSGPHYNCADAAVANASAPGPSISVDLGDTVQVTLVSDIDNQHIHSIDQHALTGNEHVNSGPIQQGHSKTWIWTAEDSGSYLYHCTDNGLMNLWTHINNGMYGNIVVQPVGADKAPAVEYNVMFADMYTTPEVDENGNSIGNNHSFDLGAFVAGDNNIMVTNGQAFNYAPFIGADWNDGDHGIVVLNPLSLDPLVVDGAPILAPTGEITRWYITNPGPNNFLALHFIAAQMDVRDGSSPKKLMTPVSNEESWTVPPGSSSTTETIFPSSGIYVGVTHKLNDVVKGGAFAVLACDVNGVDDLPTVAGIPLGVVCDADWNEDGIGGTLEDLNAFNALVSPKINNSEI